MEVFLNFQNMPGQKVKVFNIHNLIYIRNIHIRSVFLFLVIKKDSNMTPAQIAYQITNLWKKLSPEERGYYRDLAHDEKSEHNKSKLETKEKCIVNINRNKNRLLKALEKMKTMNIEKKENLVMRTTVSWDIDLKKVTENFLDR